MDKQKKKEVKRRLSLFTAAALLLTSFSIPGNVREADAEGTDTGNASYGISSPVVANGKTTWDCVYFGNYWQTDTNNDGTADQNDTKQPIKWRVLSVNGDDAFLMADKNLDSGSYNSEFCDVTWSECSLRTWLNETFLQSAFSQAEQAAIVETTVENRANEVYGTTGGEDTQDRVYLLSAEEAGNAAYGFEAPGTEAGETRKSKNTAYEAFTRSSAEEADADGYWLLRSPGRGKDMAARVWDYGAVDFNGGTVNFRYALRPVLHLNLSSSLWTDAGEVTAENQTKTVTAKPKQTVIPASPAAYGVSGPTQVEDAVTWDCVYFGKYWKNDTNEDGKADQNDAKQPIKWRVLSVNGKDAFLMADECLDQRAYHNLYENGIVWEKCELRKWLNQTFLNDAFTEAEQGALIMSTVVNDGNLKYNIDGGADTQDKVYLLSAEEAADPAYGFSSQYEQECETRKMVNTDYASAKSNGEDVMWWLRTPGYSMFHAAAIKENGYGSNAAAFAEVYAVRPVLHLDLSSELWSTAGVVTATLSAESPSSSAAPTKVPSSEAPAQSEAPSEAPAQSETPSTAVPTTAVSGSSAAPTQSSGVTEPSTDKSQKKVKAPAKVSIKSVKNVKSRKVVVKWKKVTGITEYRLCYSRDKKFKTASYILTKKKSVVLKKLKRKKTYYIRVRAYRLVKGKRVYGKWSAVKKVTIKK